jgi:hypothetical protein
MNLALLFVLIPFALIAALMAFLITWHEYQKHQFKGRKLFIESFRAALFAFAIFVLISIIIVYLLSVSIK